MIKDNQASLFIERMLAETDTAHRYDSIYQSRQNLMNRLAALMGIKPGEPGKPTCGIAA